MFSLESVQIFIFDKIPLTLYADIIQEKIRYGPQSLKTQRLLKNVAAATTISIQPKQTLPVNAVAHPPVPFTQ
jgi:hypothetical protein